MNLARICTLAALVSGLACAATTTKRLGLPPLQTVASVDLQRYLGTWYEIASFMEPYEKDCFGTYAVYSLRPDGRIDVLNSCRKGSLTGDVSTAHGQGRVVDEQTHAKLKVNFFGPFWGDYWVLELGDNYDYAVVGHPSRDHLWILSRTPQLDAQRYAGIIGRLKAVGYETDKLRPTPQAPQAEAIH
jgi:apolipoprotein D and lipocalin family protein